MTRHHLIIIVALLTILFSNCRSIYTPTTPNTPLFTDKKQFQFESTAFFNGLNGKLAYSPLKHFAIQVNGQYSKQFDQPNSNIKFHQYLEGAIGFYHCFKNKSIIEFYSGYGQGASTFGAPIISNETLLIWAKGHYEKYYGQFNIGSRKLIDDGLVGFCVRVGDVRYSYTDANFPWLINTTADHITIEPYFYYAQEINKRLSFVGSFGITVIQGLSNEAYQATMRTSLVNAGLGLRISFPKKVD